MDIKNILRELNIEFREHGESGQVSRGWVGIRCPKCSPDGKFKCGINIRTLGMFCFKCGRLPVAPTLASAANRPLRDIYPILKQIDRLASTGDEFTPIAVPTGHYQPPVGVGELLPVHRRYLEKRGFNPDYVSEHWGIRGIGRDGKHKWRLFIPVFHNGKPSAWTTRTVGQDVEPRYLSSPPELSGVLLKHCLFGSEHARHSVAIVEGPFQAMRIGDGAVAVLGIGFTEAQVVLLSRYPRRTVCFDREAGAQRRASALADALCAFPGETNVVQLSGPQPDSSPPEEIQELRERFIE